MAILYSNDSFPYTVLFWLLIVTSKNSIFKRVFILGRTLCLYSVPILRAHFIKYSLSNLGSFIMMHPLAEKKQTLRQQLRRTRKQLSSDEQHLAAQQVLRHLLQLPNVQQASCIALYLAVQGELNLQPVIEYAWKQKKQVALPVIDNQGQMDFYLYTPHTPMIQHAFGILEPKPNPDTLVPLQQIDCLLVPLVGFDGTGNRLGQGGGYYDRALAQWQQGHLPQMSPIGVAHDCQYVEHLEVESWDISLPMIVTPTKIWRF